MRRLNQVLVSKRQELNQLQQLDQSFKCLTGRHLWKQNKLAALQAFIAVAGEAEQKADASCWMAGRRVG